MSPAPRSWSSPQRGTRRRIRDRVTDLDGLLLCLCYVPLGLGMLWFLVYFVVGVPVAALEVVGTAFHGPSAVASVHAYHRAAACTQGRTRDCLEQVPATVVKKDRTPGDEGTGDSYDIWLQAGSGRVHLNVDRDTYEAVGPDQPVTLIRYEGHVTDLDYAGRRYHLTPPSGSVLIVLSCGLLTAWATTLAVLALLRRFTADLFRHLGWYFVGGLAIAATVITVVLTPVVEAIPSLYYLSWAAGLLLALPCLKTGRSPRASGPSVNASS